MKLRTAPSIPAARPLYATDRATDRTDDHAPPATLAPPAGGAAERLAQAAVHVPLPLLAAIGERLAASAAKMQTEPKAHAEPGAVQLAVQLELARLERFGLQLQEVAQVVARAQQLRHESVDLGLALLQTVAEWSAEAGRMGVELHGPACSEAVHANPAALKHLLDLMVEHALQQGRVVRLLVELTTNSASVRVVAVVSSEPVWQSPVRDTLAWQLLQWLAHGLGLRAEREAVPHGERVMVSLPRG